MRGIAVFASGGGTNFQSLLDATLSGRIQAEVKLLVASKDTAGAIARAERAGIPVLVSKDNREILEACEKRGVELVCLAGWLSKIEDPLLAAYSGRMLNIHPSLLPKFGGKGMYGIKVHEAVLREKETVSGCTVHFVDGEYDHGGAVGRAWVPVHPEDSAEDLQGRVLSQEHWLYPEVVRRFFESKLPHTGGVPMPVATQNKVVKRALISVSDKTGIIEFARKLSERGVEIVSTSGTARKLEEAGVPVRPLDSMTGFPEILGGRVKTLHPKIHGAILYRRGDEEHENQAKQHALEGIDLVAVNLYPFAETAKTASGPFSDELIEQIDIGGPTLVRASAKNHRDVVVVTSPSDYETVIREIDADSRGGLSIERRRDLAKKAFAHTASYDAMIADTLSESSTGGAEKDLSFEKVQDLRYGENPHQPGALFRVAGTELPFEQLHGKELSYNNILDFEGTWETVSDFDRPAVVINKHVTPSGVGAGETVLEAWKRAWASDPVSAFGGVAAFNRPVTAEVVADMKGKFVEVITAPGYEPEALERLKKRKNIRILVRHSKPSTRMQYRSVGDLVLAHEPDRAIWGEEPKVVTKRKPTGEEFKALRFAWIAAKAVRSNAIVLAVEDATVGIGAGQMSRVDSVHLAGLKFEAWKKENDLGGRPVALASDAFFPFRDGIDGCAKLGISCIVEPGGSIRDDEVIAAADEHGLAMIFTGMRHFRH